MVTFPSSPNYRTILLALSIVFIKTAVDTFPPLLLVAANAEEGGGFPETEPAETRVSRGLITFAFYS
jgi:hypothetical protein